jgi:hypothetical protein
MRKIGLILCLLVFAGFALADQVTRDLTPVPDGFVLSPRPHRGGSCELGLSISGAAAYYWAWAIDEGWKHYVDPATDQTYDSCWAPYFPFQITNLDFYIFCWADSADVVGYTATYEVDVECPSNLNTTYPDYCNGPGEAICTETVSHTFTMDDWTNDYYMSVPMNCCVDRPFFYGIKLIGWDGPANPDDPLSTTAPGLLSEAAYDPSLNCKFWTVMPMTGHALGAPCNWNNVGTTFVTPWGPMFMWAYGNSEGCSDPIACQPCVPVATPGDTKADPILVNTSPWSQTIDLCDYCRDYDQADVGGSFTAEVQDAVLLIAFPPEDPAPERCFTITICPACPQLTMFRIRTWIEDDAGPLYLGDPNFPTFDQCQTYDFTPAGLGCWPSNNFYLILDGRNCCCPVEVTYTGDTPLPVEMSTFEAIAGNHQVTLNWSTASELNNDYFEVQRSTVGSWMSIGQVQGAGTSTIAHNYSYVDNTVVNGVTYTYRLVSHDINGTVHVYDRTVQATPKAPVPTEYALYQNYPNPFNPQTSIAYAVKEAGFVTLKVYNLIGQEVATLVSAKMEPGRYNVTFSANGLPSGVYVYRLEVNNFTAQKKMVLLK